MAGVRQVDIDRVAARFEPALRRAFLAAVEAAKGLIPLGALADAVREGAAAVFRVLEAAKVSPAALTAVADAMVHAAQAAAIPTAAALSWRFDLPDLVAREWVLRTVGELGWLRFGVDAEWRRAAEETLRRAFVEGGHPYETARLLRDGLGLNGQQLAALDRFEAGARASGLSGEALARAVSRQEQRFLRQRAETIARTETLRAARQGQSETWRAAADEGILERDRTFREWVASSDACDICRELHGEIVRFDQPFSNGSYEADAHVNCRCSSVLVFADEPAVKAWVVKPLGEFADWDACVTTMTGRLGSKESAERYCGKLQSVIEG